MNVKIHLLLYWLSVSFTGNAATFITGKIYDENKNFIENATLNVLGTNIHTTTDSQGLYYLEMPKSYQPGAVIVLRIEKTGFKTISVRLGLNTLPHDFTLTASQPLKIDADKKIAVKAPTVGESATKSRIETRTEVRKKTVPKPIPINKLELADKKYDAVEYESAVGLYNQIIPELDGAHLYRLGNIYFYGQGVTPDTIKAVHFYQLAVDQKDADAAVALAVAYEEGKSLAADSVRAIELYQFAAEVGQKRAQQKLGALYERKGDFQSAFTWYERLAKNEDADGQLKLSIFYLKGMGVAKDTQQSYYWAKKSSKNGSTAAQEFIKQFTPNGDIVVSRDSVLEFSENFETNVNNWKLSDGFGYSTRVIRDGYMEIKNNNPHAQPEYQRFDIDCTKDYTFSVSFKIVEKSKEGATGLVFSSMKTGMNLRMCWIFSDGTVYFDDDNNSTKNYRVAAKFNSGLDVVNTATINKKGDSLFMYINDVLVDTRADKGEKGTTFGVLVSGTQTVRFYRFYIKGTRIK